MINRYTTSDISVIWDESTKYIIWWNVEYAICKKLCELGIIPKHEFDIIPEYIDTNVSEIQAIESKTKHDFVAFLRYIEKYEWHKWIHLGITSSDVVDTAFSIRLSMSRSVIINEMSLCCRLLSGLANTYKYCYCIGRTHGMPAQVITIGLVFLNFYTEIKRNQERIKRASNFPGKISGAVGTYFDLCHIPVPHVIDWPNDFEKKILADLGLSSEPITTQIIPRDIYAEYFNALAILASSIERMALYIRNSHRWEVNELCEGMVQGQVGSSSMPHKVNPIGCENLCGLARLVRGYAQSALDDIPLWYERDISHSSVERVIAPDANNLIHFMLKRFNEILRNLDVNMEVIRDNLVKNFAKLTSGATLTTLIWELVGPARSDIHESLSQSFNSNTDVLLQPYTEEEVYSKFQSIKFDEVIDSIFNRTYERYSLTEY